MYLTPHRVAARGPSWEYGKDWLLGPAIVLLAAGILLLVRARLARRSAVDPRND